MDFTPIFASNMDGVGTFSMAKVLQKHKMMTVITKNTTVEQWKEAVGTGLRLQSVSVCTGTNKIWDPEAADYKNMQDVLNSFPDVKMITIDVANAYHQNFVDFIKTWGGTWVEYGDDADWMPLVNFVTGQDMTDPDNYDYVTSVYNVMSLIDYYLLNSFTVCADWLNWNTAWWRGRNPDGDARRWRYALWDLDNTFGHGANYTGLPDTGAEADPCNPENMGDVGGQGHIPVLNALMDNETFWATYINRWADLGNTHFTCDNMHAVLDSMIGVIEPEMPRQIERWDGNLAAWEEAVQEVHDFIDERCNETVLSGMEDCYDVEPVDLTILIQGCGEVELNSFDIDPSMVPFTGWYFAGVPISLEAEEECVGAEFLYWEVVSGDVVIDDIQNPFLEIELTGDAAIMAHFGEPVPPEVVPPLWTRQFWMPFWAQPVGSVWPVGVVSNDSPKPQFV